MQKTICDLWQFLSNWFKLGVPTRVNHLNHVDTTRLHSVNHALMMIKNIFFPPSCQCWVVKAPMWTVVELAKHDGQDRTRQSMWWCNVPRWCCQEKMWTYQCEYYLTMFLDSSNELYEFPERSNLLYDFFSWGLTSTWKDWEEILEFLALWQQVSSITDNTRGLYSWPLWERSTTWVLVRGQVLVFEMVSLKDEQKSLRFH